MRNVIKGFHFSAGRASIHATPAARLALFRGLSASYAGGDWRAAREAMHAPESSPISAGFNSRGAGTKWESRKPVMYGFNAPLFRGEMFGDERDDVRTDHKGWFSDADCSRTLRAFVFNLPHGRFGCGYADSDSGSRVYLLGVFDNAQAAFSDADSEAQHYAEEEAAYNERWQKAHELRAEVAQSETRLRAYLSARNDSRTEGRELARMELDNLRAFRKEAEAYSDIDE